jgi:hemerythrin
MLSRNKRIECKVKALKRLDPECEVELEDAFTNHLADAIRTSSLEECQLEIDKATEAYEDALNRTLYELLDKHIVNEDSSAA